MNDDRMGPSNSPGSSQDRLRDPAGSSQGRTSGPRGPEWLARLDRQGGALYDRQTLADAVLQAALSISGAPRGNVQFLDARGMLCIEAQHGFKAPFLEYFRSVHAGQAACGAAASSGKPVIVEDVSSNALFVGTPALEVMTAAGALAVISLPILRRKELVGVFSVHYDKPHRPSARSLAMLQSIAARTGKLL